ncbi:hypothetical protein MG293_014799 [Ovis ammon polii]|uniref:Uncharacterized protein n=1 Tax=Ovis ammon polii TaxID=230172 RepID=A0AAD4Y5R9_OVIAM|nr:hypothetical protein MG293_014799 [Ovis ammon polii]
MRAAPPPARLLLLLLLLALLGAPAARASRARSAAPPQPGAERQPRPPPGPGPGNATGTGSGEAAGGGGGGGSNSSGDALVTRISSLLRDLPTLKAAVIVACAFTAFLIACLLLRVFRSHFTRQQKECGSKETVKLRSKERSGKRLKKTRKYDIITTPAERVEMAPLNEEDDEDEDSTVFDIKYSRELKKEDAEKPEHRDLQLERKLRVSDSMSPVMSAFQAPFWYLPLIPVEGQEALEIMDLVVLAHSKVLDLILMPLTGGVGSPRMEKQKYCGSEETAEMPKAKNKTKADKRLHIPKPGFRHLNRVYKDSDLETSVLTLHPSPISKDRQRTCKQAQRIRREETDVEIAGATRRQGWSKSNKGMHGEETKMTSGFQNWVERLRKKRRQK